MLRNDLKTAFRRLFRNKLFSLINIGGLSVGLACCILIILYTKDELSFDRFHMNIDRIFQLTCHRFSAKGEDKHFAIAGMVQGPSFKREIPEIEAFVRVVHQPMIIKKGNDSFSEMVTWADSSFFSVFSFPLLEGNKNTVFNHTHSVVLSEESAKKYFSGKNAVGQNLELEIDGTFQLFVVSGVAKKPVENSSIQFSMLLPFAYLQEIHPDNGWMWVSYPTYFLLRKGTDINSVNRKMNLVYTAGAKDELSMNALLGYSDQFTWGLEPLPGMHMNAEFEGNPGTSNPIYSYMLTGIAFCILMIACINFINLAIAQSLQRSKEIGLRKVIGAHRKQLVRQFLAESFLTCLIAFAIAFLAAEFLLPFFNEIANKQLSLQYLLDYQLIIVFILLFILTGFAAGFYPALVLSGFKPVEALYSRSKTGGKNYLGKALVVLQFSLAIFLMICTAFAYAQFDFLVKSDPGYDDHNLVEITIERAILDRQLDARCKTVFGDTPGVEQVTSINVGRFGGKTIIAEKEINALYLHGDGDYLPVLHIPILAGRNFSRQFPSDTLQSVLVNETFAKEAGLKDPVGKSIDYMNIPGWGTRKVVIIGLFKDYHFESLKEKIKPEVLTLEPALPLGKFYIRLKPSGIPSTLRLLGKGYRQIFPNHPFQYAFKDDLNMREYETASRMKMIVCSGAVMTILISGIGLFALTLLSVNRRIKEIGIRKVLGSGVFTICVLVCRQFIVLVGFSYLLAAPLAWMAVSHWLENYAYKIGFSWLVFLLTGIVTLFIALLTVSFQSLRAARANPIHSLRTE